MVRGVVGWSVAAVLACVLCLALCLSLGLGLGLGLGLAPWAGPSAVDDGPEPPGVAADAGPPPHTSPTDPRPNLVLVTADDLRADEMVHLPRTRRLLGAAGMTFTDALSPHPLCCPARAELFTGQYAHNNGVRSNAEPSGGYGAYDPTHNVGRWLNEAGYNTGFVGKHLNALPLDLRRDPGWTIFDPTLRGYGDYVDFVQYADGAPRQVRGPQSYYTDWLADRSTAYAHRLSAYDAPFFLWVSHFAPHAAKHTDCDGGGCRIAPPPASPHDAGSDAGQAGLDARDRRLADRRVARLLRAGSLNEADTSDKQRLLATAEPVDTAAVRELARGRAAALRALDRAVARLVRRLEADGELDNTYLAFATDNGFLLGEHRWLGKDLGYEPALRTPLLVRGPGVEAGSRSDETVTLVDLVPTWLDVAGATPTVPQDGVSLVDLLHQRPHDPPHPGGVLIQVGPRRGETMRGWYLRGVRTDRYTYMRFHDGWVELYDRLRDPHQLRSVSNDPAYTEVLAELARRTQALSDCQGPEECNQAFGGEADLEVPGAGRRGDRP